MLYLLTAVNILKYNFIVLIVFQEKTVKMKIKIWNKDIKLIILLNILIPGILLTFHKTRTESNRLILNFFIILRWFNSAICTLDPS